MAIDRLARRHRLELSRTKFEADYDTGVICGADVVLLEPQTFMNLSGQSVQAAASFYKIEPEDIIVAHDDIDLDLGVLRLKKGGGHGGHNGLRDIAQKLGTRDFLRVRLGVGRPGRGVDVTSHVLGRFRDDEAAEVRELLDHAGDAIEVLLDEGLAAAQNRFHSS
jgi:PTH1 family peptidyl-tRNA hydrolase